MYRLRHCITNPWIHVPFVWDCTRARTLSCFSPLFNSFFFLPSSFLPFFAPDGSTCMWRTLRPAKQREQTDRKERGEKDIKRGRKGLTLKAEGEKREERRSTFLPSSFLLYPALSLSLSSFLSFPLFCEQQSVECESPGLPVLWMLMVPNDVGSWN